MKSKAKFRIAAVLVGALAALPGLGAKPAMAGPDPFIGELMLFGGNFCPRFWARADGQLLPIAQNSALFSILGTTYGGDGRTTFGLPDLRGRAPIGQGQGPGLPNYQWGQKGGSHTHTMTEAEMPSHNHLVNGTNQTGNKFAPGSDYLAGGDPAGGHQAYHDGPPNRTMDPGVISNTGGGQPFNIQDPYLSMYWCIATQGIFPSRS